MSDEPDNIVLLHLRAIRDELQELRSEQREQRIRLGAIERILSHLERDGAEGRAEASVRMDRLADRLDRIERRLDIVAA